MTDRPIDLLIQDGNGVPAGWEERFRLAQEAVMELAESIRDKVSQISPPKDFLKKEIVPYYAGQDPLEVATRLRAEVNLTHGGDLFLRVNISRRLTITRVIRYDADGTVREIEHGYFVLAEHLRGKGIVPLAERMTARLLDSFKIPTIRIKASLNVGGYKWLRDGFFPDGGAQKLSELAQLRTRGKKAEVKALAAEAAELFGKMTNDEARDFVKSEEFRRFKDVFAGLTWEGGQSAESFLARVSPVTQEKSAAVESLVAGNTANELLEDALIRHQTYLLRYSDGLRNQINAQLNKSEIAIAERIRERLRGNAGLTTPVEIRRLQSLKATIAAMRQKTWDKATETMTQQLSDLAKNEPLYTQTILNTSSPVVLDTVLPTALQLRAIVKSRPFEGAVLKEWAAKMAAEDIRRIQHAVQLGMTAGESSVAIARRVVGTGQMLGADGVTELTRRQLTTVVRTAVSHVSTQARNDFFKENSDIFDQERFVATLDGRTSPICRSLDGEQFDIGAGPMPPLHFNCRSTRVPMLDGEVLGNRPSVPVVEDMLLEDFVRENKLGKGINKRADLPKGFKGLYDEWKYPKLRAMVGQVPSKTTYSDWLKRQSAAFQNDTLGVKKAKLFRSGALSLDKFVSESGRELTLDQLAAKYPAAFK